MEASEQPPAETIEPAAVRARASHLSTAVLAPLTTLTRRALVGLGLVAGAGLVVGIATREPLLCALIVFDGSLVALLIAWWPFFDPSLRDAAELILDHDSRERAEWKTETGNSMPRGLKATERWLARHPDSPGRASLLLVSGHLDAADRAIDAMAPTTPDQAFAQLLLRQTRVLFASETPDLAGLHDAWAALPDPIERGHRRQCVALIEARVAVDRGEDPAPVLAVARQEGGAIRFGMRAPVLVARWLFLALLLVVGTTLITFLVVS